MANPTLTVSTSPGPVSVASIGDASVWTGYRKRTQEYSGSVSINYGKYWPSEVYSIELSLNSMKSICVANYFYESAQKEGDVVEFLPNSFLPVVHGNDGNPVFLFEVFEEIDEAIDYNELRSNLPTLTAGQIAGARAFIRRLTQFNTQGIDIEELIDEHIASTPEFQDAIRKSLQGAESNVHPRR